MQLYQFQSCIQVHRVRLIGNIAQSRVPPGWRRVHVLLEIEQRIVLTSNKLACLGSHISPTISGTERKL